MVFIKITKKSQVEIVGLLIIVVLFVMMMFIVVAFKSRATPRSIHKSFSYDQLTSSFIVSLLKTHSECTNNVNFIEVIQDCALYKRLDCNGDDSCTYLNNSFKIILNNTLDKFGFKYHFDIASQRFSAYNNFTFDNNCSGNIAGSSFQPIRLWPLSETLLVEISICES